VTAPDESRLTQLQLAAFQAVLHQGAEHASGALGRWVQKPTRIAFDSVDQLPLHEATSLIGVNEEPICFCAAEMRGRLTGQLILMFDDASGLRLADILLDQPRGTATEWLELETSAALETTNILFCAYLNALARVLPEADPGPSELIPSPPRFSRDFAASLIEFAVMDQIIATDHVLLARTQFHIDGTPVDWTLLFVPDVASMATLQDVLQ
jgi:chemotaxis protein CheC